MHAQSGQNTSGDPILIPEDSLPFAFSDVRADSPPYSGYHPCPWQNSENWYYFEPTQDTFVELTGTTPSGSTGWMEMGVLTYEFGEWNQVISCHAGYGTWPAKEAFLAKAGTGYYIAISKWAGDSLIFNMQASVPLQIGVVVNPEDLIMPRLGTAVVSGQVSCNKPAVVDLGAWGSAVNDRYDQHFAKTASAQSRSSRTEATPHPISHSICACVSYVI